MVITHVSGNNSGIMVNSTPRFKQADNSIYNTAISTFLSNKEGLHLSEPFLEEFLLASNSLHLFNLSIYGSPSLPIFK